MAIIDKIWEFSDYQTMAVAAGDHDPTNSPLDIGYSDPNLGAGTPLWVNVVVASTIHSAASAMTLVIELWADNTDGDTTQIYETAAFAGDATGMLTGKVLLSMPLPAEHGRYVNLVYRVAGSTGTLGRVDAWIGLTPVRSI